MNENAAPTPPPSLTPLASLPLFRHPLQATDNDDDDGGSTTEGKTGETKFTSIEDSVSGMNKLGENATEKKQKLSYEALPTPAAESFRLDRQDGSYY